MDFVKDRGSFVEGDISVEVVFPARADFRMVQRDEIHDIGKIAPVQLAAVAREGAAS